MGSDGGLVGPVLSSCQACGSLSEGQQAGQSGEVAGGPGQGESGADAFGPAQHRLGHAADGLGPAEGLLDLLSAFLRQGVTGVAGGAPVDGGMADLAGDMWRDAGLPQLGDEVGAVVAVANGA